MTDEQIIKALECCNGYDCETCKALKYCDYMHPGALARASLDLINRKKAEIEDLKSQMEWLTGYNGNLLDANTALSGEIEICKSEAIKEFAERLKDDMRLDEECKYNCISCCYECKEFVPQIDNLVKEMTEDAE